MSQPSGGQPDYDRISNLGPRKLVITEPSFETRYGNKQFGASWYAKPKMIHNSNIEIKTSRSGVGPLRFTPKMVTATPRSFDKPVELKAPEPQSTGPVEIKIKRRRLPKVGKGQFCNGRPCPEQQSAPRSQLKWPLINMPDKPEYNR